MIIDLSITVNDQIPVYPGDPAFRAEATESFETNGYKGYFMHMGTHVGTHIDAPAHMIEGGKTIDRFPIETFMGEAVCIAGFDMAALRNNDIRAGDIVLFYTGMGKRFYAQEYFTDYPAMDSEVAAYLIEKQVKMVGMDTCSADNSEGFPIHKQLLGADILLIENLTKLKPLVGKRFKLTALPLNLVFDAAPARVIAEV